RVPRGERLLGRRTDDSRRPGQGDRHPQRPGSPRPPRPHRLRLLTAAILTRMATRADFTDQEWTALESGAPGAGVYVSLVDRSFFDTFKESNALAHHLREAHERSSSELVRELAKSHDRPFGVTSSPQEVEDSTVATLQAAVAALQAKSPDDLPAYRD